MTHYNSRSDWSNLEFVDEETKKSLTVVKGNVEDSSFIDSKTKGHDIIFHLAALIGIPYSYEAPLSYVRTNIVGTVNILEAARKNDTELVVNTSTSKHMALLCIHQLMSFIRCKVNHLFRLENFG